MSDTTATVAIATINNPAIIEAFKDAIKAVRSKAGTALRVTFIKSDNTIRVMDVAFDPEIRQAVSHHDSYPVMSANAKRHTTNELHDNVVVRERLKAVNGIEQFQWRTIPLRRIVSVSVC